MPEDLAVEPLAADLVKISWKSGSIVSTLYSVERKAGISDYIEIGRTGSTEFIDSTLVSSVSDYTYRVMALTNDRSSDPTFGKKISRVTEGTLVWDNHFPGSVREVIFSNDGEKLIVADGNGTIRVYDVYTGIELISASLDGSIYDIDINNKGTKIVAGTSQTAQDSSYNMVVLVDMNTGDVLWSDTFERQIATVRFSSDGQTVASGSYDNKTRLHKVKDGSVIWTGINDSYVNEVDISPELEFVASASWDNYLRVWDYSSGDLLWEHELMSSVWKVAVAHDNSYIVSGDNDQTLTVFDSQSGNILWQFQGNGFLGLYISRNDSMILSAHADKTICFDRDGNELWETEKTGQVCFNDTGDRICITGNNGEFQVIDAADGTTLWTGSHGDGDFVSASDFCSDNYLLATGAWGKMLKVWIARNGWILSEKLGD